MTEPLFAYGWPGVIFVLWIGLCVGSFLNVVIHRLPIMLQRDWEAEAREILHPELEPDADLDPDAEPAEVPAPDARSKFNLMVPRSRCPHCGAGISAWQNIPVVSWLLLRGRCAACGSPIGIRYPAVELITGLLTVTVLALFGFTPFGYAALVFTWVLIALTCIDYDTQLLPDQLTLPLLWLGLLVNLNGGLVDLQSAVVGAVAGYLFLWSTYWAFKLVTGREGMGYGDFKLLGAIGAWLGWQVLPATVLVAAAVGLLYALITSLTGKRQAAQAIPFGPFLAIAGWVCLVQRDTVLDLFLI